MPSFHYFISQLKDDIIGYRLPYNSFLLDNALIFMDHALSTEIQQDSFVFLGSDVFQQCLRKPLPPRVCFFVGVKSGDLPDNIPHTVNYIALSLPFPVMCTRVISLLRTYTLNRPVLSQRLATREAIEAWMNRISEQMDCSVGLYSEQLLPVFRSERRPSPSAPPAAELIDRFRERGQDMPEDSDTHFFAHIESRESHQRNFYLVLTRNRSFDDFDVKWFSGEALRHILENIQKHEIPLYTFEEQSVEQFIRDIMEENFQNPADIDVKLHSMNRSQASHHSVIYIRMPHKADTIAHSLLMPELRRLFPDSLIGPCRNDIVLFVPNPDRTTVPPVPEADFTSLLETYGAYAGCSLFSKMRFRTCIIMAEANATFGQALPMEKGRRIFYHNDYSMYHLIDLAAQSFQQVHHTRDLTYLIHPGVLRINTYDLKHGTNLLEVLYQYLISGCSIIDTAARMKVHRNTIQTRLQKLNELLEDDYTRSGIIQCRLLVSCMVFF